MGARTSSLIIAYSHCIAHGIDMGTANGQQKAAVDSGHWPLYRYDPCRAEQGKNPLQLDSRAPKIAFPDRQKNQPCKECGPFARLFFFYSPCTKSSTSRLKPAGRARWGWCPQSGRAVPTALGIASTS